MEAKESLLKIKREIQQGIQHAKCRKCGCMKETLENLLASLPLIDLEESSALLHEIKTYSPAMEPLEYTCLGCEYCYPAVAANTLAAAFPSLLQPDSLSCTTAVESATWPSVAGQYFAFCKGVSCPVAVSTLASLELTEALAHLKPEGLCIVGKTETENIGLEKIIKNVITNPTIRYLIVAGIDPQGHHSGQTLVALAQDGIDGEMRVIGSPARRPFLRNVSPAEVERFRTQVQLINMMGCEDAKRIAATIDQLSQESRSTCACQECSEQPSAVQVSTVPKVMAGEPRKLTMDEAGYFIIIPSPQKNLITVEHYSYDNALLRTIEGKDAPSLYSTIIENGWLTQLSHAAYLGRELAKAELSLKYGFKYVQDKAPGNSEEK